MIKLYNSAFTGNKCRSFYLSTAIACSVKEVEKTFTFKNIPEMTGYSSSVTGLEPVYRQADSVPGRHGQKVSLSQNVRKSWGAVTLTNQHINQSTICQGAAQKNSLSKNVRKNGGSE